MFPNFPSLPLRTLAAGMALVVVPAALPAQAAVPLMAGQSARPLGGRFNSVPVLHSNQPEEVEGPGILVSTLPGFAYAAETGRPLKNAVYTFKGAFGLHLHHKYYPPYRKSIDPKQRRTELTLATILVNPGPKPVHIRFEAGAVRNSFEAPYLGRHLMGVRPLGPRPWNTGPGDATAVQLLRGRIDRGLQDEITIPGRGRIVLFRTQLPALGIANALLKGRSDGPFQMAVVAARNPRSDGDILAVLDAGRLAPGRVYLDRLAEIRNGTVFSRVAGVALGDRYEARLSHDLQARGALHVPLTSTVRTHFGTREVQVNALASRMEDSALDNVGTYGVRFDVDLDLRGSGPHELVLSHPASPPGRSPFTAFRGSLQVRLPEGLREMHVGLPSGRSVSLASLNLSSGVPYPVRVSLVYPADATPGHLLSVVPRTQLARLREQEQQTEPVRPPAAPAARTGPAPQQAAPTRPAAAPPRPAPPGVPPPPAVTDLRPPPPPATEAPPSPAMAPPPPRDPLVPLRPPTSQYEWRGKPTAVPPPSQAQPGEGETLLDRYRRAVDAQRRLIEGRQSP